MAAARTPGPRPTVTAEQIVDAALAEGIHRFTLPAVARRIGLSHSGIYRYFADRDALVDACLVRAADSLDRSAPPEDWQETLHHFADTLWDAFEHYPGTAEALLQATVIPATIVEWEVGVLQHLVERGLDPHAARTALEMIADLVWIGVIGAERIAETVASGLTRGESLERSWDHDTAQPQWHGRGFLHTKIDLLVAGLRPLSAG